MTFRDELRGLLNRRSMENASNTPDYILAYYLLRCPGAFDRATNDRDDWYGRSKVKTDLHVAENAWQGGRDGG